jgi:hypothetical protein
VAAKTPPHAHCPVDRVAPSAKRALHGLADFGMSGQKDAETPGVPRLVAKPSDRAEVSTFSFSLPARTELITTHAAR